VLKHPSSVDYPGLDFIGHYSLSIALLSPAGARGNWTPKWHCSSTGSGDCRPKSCQERTTCYGRQRALNRSSRANKKGRDHSRPLRFSAWRRYQVTRDIASLSQGFLALRPASPRPLRDYFTVLRGLIHLGVLLRRLFLARASSAQSRFSLKSR
jgi:hypothetical protein